MIPKYFDIHSHLNFADFDEDRKEVIKRILAHGVWTIVVGTDFESSKKAVEIAEKYEGIYATVGLHPTTKLEDLEIQFPFGNWISKLRELALHPKVVAIGECGLDSQIPKGLPFGNSSRGVLWERQKDIFKQQIELALELDKPLMIHCRDAHNEVIDIISRYGLRVTGYKPRGDIHFFSGNLEQAQKYFELGFLISFTGVITFARDYDEIIRNASLDKIMIETDAPFVAPVPHRGKRNEPLYVIEVAKKIAEIRDEPYEKILQATTANALKLFRI